MSNSRRAIVDNFQPGRTMHCRCQSRVTQSEIPGEETAAAKTALESTAQKG